MTRSVLRILLLLSSAALAACAVAPRAPSDGEHWRVQGRIGIWDQDLQESANIDWQQCGPDRGILRLSGPMGVGGIEIRSDARGAELRRGDEHLRASSIDELAASAGWPVPVTALRFWIRGKAAPDAPLQGQLGPRGRFTELEQHGWLIRYLDYADVERDNLPLKIDARREKQRLKLIIQHWTDADCTP